MELGVSVRGHGISPQCRQAHHSTQVQAEVFCDAVQEQRLLKSREASCRACCLLNGLRLV